MQTWKPDADREPIPTMGKARGRIKPMSLAI
jgi:hypothetical protein